MLAGGGQHVLGNVDSNHPPFMQSIEQFARQSPGTTTCIHQHFIATKSEPGEDLLAPTDLRL